MRSAFSQYRSPAMATKRMLPYGHIRMTLLQGFILEGHTHLDLAEQQAKQQLFIRTCSPHCQSVLQQLLHRSRPTNSQHF